MTYKQQLLDPRWQKKRLEILERDNFECKLCYDPGTTLHIHHIKYRKCLAWEYENDELITYCKHCHSIIEYYKNKDSVTPIALYKKDFCMDVVNLYFLGYDGLGSVIIDIFEYSEETLKYLTSMDMHTVYILNRIVRENILKEDINV